MWAAADALKRYTLDLPGNENVRSVNPVAGETNDGRLNDIRGEHLQRGDFLAAILGSNLGGGDHAAAMIDQQVVNWFKQIMGFVLLATVVWIFSYLNADYFVPTLALLFSLWAACWWIGRTPLTAEASEKIKAYLSAGGFAALLGWFSFRLLLPGVEVDWSEYTPQALANLRDRNVTVLVDFTADW